MARRALHYVFKIGDRNSTIKFYREILGMKVLNMNTNSKIYLFVVSLFKHFV